MERSRHSWPFSKEILSEEGYDVRRFAGDGRPGGGAIARTAINRSGSSRHLDARHRRHHACCSEWQAAARPEASCPVGDDVPATARWKPRSKATRLRRFRLRRESPLSLARSCLRTGRARGSKAGHKRKRHARKVVSRIARRARGPQYASCSSCAPILRADWPATIRRCLLVGETGTGAREALCGASSTTPMSAAARGPFVMLISSTLARRMAPDQVVVRHRGGPARWRPGCAGERARRGKTLFVNEPRGNLPLHAQRALLGALESGQFHPGRAAASPVTLKARLLSSARPGHRDPQRRIPSTTCWRNLEHADRACGRPLREYTEDVPDLLRHYVDRLVDGERPCHFGKIQRRGGRNRLRNYPWPDNVRELKNLVQRLLAPGWRAKKIRPRGRSNARARRAGSDRGAPWSSRTCWRCRLREARETVRARLPATAAAAL